MLCDARRRSAGVLSRPCRSPCSTSIVYCLSTADARRSGLFRCAAVRRLGHTYPPQFQYGAEFPVRTRTSSSTLYLVNFMPRLRRAVGSPCAAASGWRWAVCDLANGHRGGRGATPLNLISSMYMGFVQKARRKSDNLLGSALARASQTSSWISAILHFSLIKPICTCSTATSTPVENKKNGGRCARP